jgi:aminopeptidase
MLEDPRIARMARVLVDYSVSVQEGWEVAIVGAPVASPLIKSICREVIAKGAHPYVLYLTPWLEEMLLADGNEAQLTRVNPYSLRMVQESDAIIRILSEENTRSYNNVDPKRLGLLKKGAGPVGSGYMKRIMEGRPHSLTLFPTEAYAQDAEMSLSEFEEFVFKACLLDDPERDAAERWREVSHEQQRIVDWLAGKKNVLIQAPGTNLEMSIVGRTFVNSDGKRNFPSGEVFTSPVHETVRGHITFTYPASYNGRTVQGVYLRFEDGRVVEHSADAGGDYLAAMLDLDEGARKLGEFAIGTNSGVTRITRNTLFDEKIAGTIHCALGNAYPNAGGTNTSAIHWDMVTDMKEGHVIVDGVTLYENGKFVI